MLLIVGKEIEMIGTTKEARELSKEVSSGVTRKKYEKETQCL